MRDRSGKNDLKGFANGRQGGESPSCGAKSTLEVFELNGTLHLLRASEDMRSTEGFRVRISVGRLLIDLEVNPESLGKSLLRSRKVGSPSQLADLAPSHCNRKSGDNLVSCKDDRQVSVPLDVGFFAICRLTGKEKEKNRPGFARKS